MSSLKTSDSKIPVVDLGQIGLEHKGEPSQEEWQRVARQLNDVFTDIGFVYLSNHGVPDHQMSNVLKSAASFFSLDQEKKNRYSRDQETMLGYVAMNRETLDTKERASELRESYMMKSGGKFPDADVPGLRPATEVLLESCTALTVRILIAIALGLDVDRDFFVSAHKYMSKDGNMTSLRIQHYPPVPNNTQENAIRCGTHTDYGTITLLFQDNIGGLQVRDRRGEWVDADPMPGAILMNVGDLLQLWTANKFIATEHRVVIPSQELQRRTSRFSAAFFVQADDQALISPIDGSTTSGPPVTSLEYLQERYSKTFHY